MSGTSQQENVYQSGTSQNGNVYQSDTSQISEHHPFGPNVMTLQKNMWRLKKLWYEHFSIS